MPTAHSSSFAHAPTSTHLDSLEDPQHDSRGTGEALSRLASNMPFMGPLKQLTEPLKQFLGLFLIQAYSPILKPFEILNVLTNHMFSRLAPNLPDTSYELLYKVIPTEFISKAAGKIGLNGGINQISKFIISGLAKAKIKINEDKIKPLINEIVTDLSHMYNPEFLKQFKNTRGHGFIVRALREGDVVFNEIAGVLTDRAVAKIGHTAAQALSQEITISDGTAQAAGTEAITKTTQKTAHSVKQTADAANKNTQKAIKTDIKQTLNAGQPITSQATQNLPIQKTATDKKAQGPNNNPKPGLFSNLLTSGNNILKSITGIFSPKPAPAAA
jgi:hypothetical protein